MRNKINCSTYKNSIIIKKEQFEHFRTSVQMSYCDSTYSSKLKYMKTCKITGSDCMTSLFYGYGNDSLETNSSMLLVLQPSWDVLLNGAVPSLHPPPDASSSFLRQTWHGCGCVISTPIPWLCNSQVSRTDTNYSGREKRSSPFWQQPACQLD